MQKAILIAEKPSYMKDLRDCYNKHKKEIPYEIDFMAQAGHAVTLLEPDELDPAYKQWDENLLPIEPENMGGWKYKVIKGMGNIIKEAKEKVHSGDYDLVIHAGDPDQEGELLTRLLLKAVGNKLPVIRMWPNATTDADLLKGFKSMTSDSDPQYENLYNAALIRQHSDWRFGMNGSRAVACRVTTTGKCAMGRVMTAVQAIIVQREDDILAFVPRTTYGVSASFDQGYDGQLFREVTVYDEEKKEDKIVNELIYFDSKEEAEDKINELGSSGKVISVTKTKSTKYPPTLYDLADAQSDGAKYGLTPEQTLNVIQRLYEKHVITYPRTDCCVLSTEEDFEGMLDALEHISEFAEAIEIARDNVERIKKNTKYVNNKELQKHGHSALAPTTDEADLASLSQEERQIYLMIVKRFLGIFQPPLVESKKKIVTKIGEELFVTNGKTIVDKGYTEFLGIETEEKPLPDVKKDDTVSVISTEITEKNATPPKRFTNGTIVDAMKNPKKYLYDKNSIAGISDFHIGTSATRGNILKKLVSYGYIEDKKGTLRPTEWGSAFIHHLKNVDITKVDMTGKWEQLLEQVRSGDISVEQGEDVMRKEVNRMVRDILSMEAYTFGDVNVNRKIIGKCPDCGKDIISSEKSFFCAGYKEGCKNTIWKQLSKTITSKITAKEAMDLINGNEINKKLEKDGKSWMQGLKLNKATGKLEFVTKEAQLHIPCPLCSQKLQMSGSKITCSCGFSLWNAIKSGETSKSLNEKDLEDVLTNKRTSKKIKGFISKKGNKFDAYITYTASADDPKKHYLKFDFGE